MQLTYIPVQPPNHAFFSFVWLHEIAPVTHQGQAQQQLLLFALAACGLGGQALPFASATTALETVLGKRQDLTQT
jgi:predicted small lipoprotein YifL